MKIAVVNTKGGVGKTTTAIYLAAGLHKTGRTLLVDADRQQSASRWSETEDWPADLPVVARASADLHRHLPSLAAGFDHVIVDTPPGDTGVISSAVMAVDMVIVPVAPTGLDVDRMRPTWELLTDIEPVHPVLVGVLLTKVRARTLSARDIRKVLDGIGYPVLETEIPLAEMYAGSFGFVPAVLGRYGDLLTEIKS